MESNLRQCEDCRQRCCRYITVKIPAPRTIRDFDGLLWHVSHKNVAAFRDHGGWHLIIYDPCSHLRSNGRCSIYENRPITCREHSTESCEYDNPIPEAAVQFFDGYASLNEYCRKRFKTWDRRF
jgi:Fe-S-cluster containining protein